MVLVPPHAFPAPKGLGDLRLVLVAGHRELEEPRQECWAVLVGEAEGLLLRQRVGLGRGVVRHVPARRLRV